MAKKIIRTITSDDLPPLPNLKEMDNLDDNKPAKKKSAEKKASKKKK